MRGQRNPYRHLQQMKDDLHEKGVIAELQHTPNKVPFLEVPETRQRIVYFAKTGYTRIFEPPEKGVQAKSIWPTQDEAVKFVLRKVGILDN